MKRSKTSPTSRTLKVLRERGYTAEKVEQRIQAFTRDLFNCLDVVAMGHGTIVGVQVTSGANHAARREKIRAEPMMRRWLENGGALSIHSWSKRGARGKRKKWELREEEITLADLPAENLGMDSHEPQGQASSNGEGVSQSPAHETAKPAGCAERR